jgi:hypothetical protein
VFAAIGTGLPGPGRSSVWTAARMDANRQADSVATLGRRKSVAADLLSVFKAGLFYFVLYLI